MISRFRTTAFDDFSSKTKAARFSPAVYLSIRAIASSMSSTSNLAERLDKRSLGANYVSVARAERPRGDEVHSPAESRLEKIRERH
jgi:hypothetical protein